MDDLALAGTPKSSRVNVDSEVVSVCPVFMRGRYPVSRTRDAPLAAWTTT